MSRKRFRIETVPYAGIVCAFVSVIFWSSASLCVKLALEVHALEALAISSLIQAVIYFLVIIAKNQPIFGVPNERVSLVLRCGFGTISLACLYMAYRLISLSDATTIRYTAPVFVNAFAFVILGEPFGLKEVVNAATTITGVLLIGRPSFLFQDNADADTVLGLALALIASVSIALSMTVMRRLQKTPAAVVIFWFSIGSVGFSFVALQILQTFKFPNISLDTWLILIAAAIAGALDQLFITLALKLENAGPVEVVRALSVVISFVFSATILDEPIEWNSFAGGALIFLSIVLVGFSKCMAGDSSPKTGANLNAIGGEKQQSAKEMIAREAYDNCAPTPVLVNYYVYNVDNFKC